MQQWIVTNPQIGMLLANHGTLEMYPTQFQKVAPRPVVGDTVSLAIPGDRDGIKGRITMVTETRVTITLVEEQPRPTVLPQQ